jgi:hypothetical protein
VFLPIRDDLKEFAQLIKREEKAWQVRSDM